MSQQSVYFKHNQYTDILAFSYIGMWVILETTGLAYPEKILTSLNKYGKGIEIIKVITVVDAERFNELTIITPVLVQTQISEGNIVLINKIDLVEETDLLHVVSHVKHLNPKANIYGVIANKKIENSIWEEVMRNYE